MDNLEIHQPRPAGGLVKDHVVCAGLAMRPAVAKVIAPELMSAPEFVASCFHHLSCERALLQMLPQSFSRQLIGADCVVTRRPRTKTIAIKHIETVHLPAL